MKKVRVVVGKNETYDIEFQRVPCVGENIFISESDLIGVLEVFWRVDGSASLLCTREITPRGKI